MRRYCVQVGLPTANIYTCCDWSINWLTSFHFTWGWGGKRSTRLFVNVRHILSILVSRPKFIFSPTFIFCSPICPYNCGVVSLWKYVLVFEKWFFFRSTAQICKFQRDSPPSWNGCSTSFHVISFIHVAKSRCKITWMNEITWNDVEQPFQDGGLSQ